MTEIFLSFADDTAADDAKIGRVVVKVVETEAVVLADPTSGEVVDHMIDVEEIVTSGVVFEAGLLVELRYVAICETEAKALTDPLLEETRAMAGVELWPESVGAEAAIQGISHR